MQYKIKFTETRLTLSSRMIVVDEDVWREFHGSNAPEEVSVVYLEEMIGDLYDRSIENWNVTNHYEISEVEAEVL